MDKKNLIMNFLQLNLLFIFSNVGSTLMKMALTLFFDLLNYKLLVGPGHKAEKLFFTQFCQNFIFGLFKEPLTKI